MVSAGVYRKADRLLLHSVAPTKAGIGVSVPPVHRLAVDAPEVSIGAALRTVLSSPPGVVSSEKWQDWGELGRQFLKEAGFRSWRQLDEGSKYCWVAAHDRGITLTPLRNGGRSGDRKGFQPFGAEVVTVEVDAPNEQLGAAVLEALARCQ